MVLYKLRFFLSNLRNKSLGLFRISISGVGNGNVFSASRRKITNKAVTNQGFGTYKRYAKNLNGHFLNSSKPYRSFFVFDFFFDREFLNARRNVFFILFWFYLFIFLSLWITFHEESLLLQYVPERFEEVRCNIYGELFFYSHVVTVKFLWPIYEQLVLVWELVEDIFVPTRQFLLRFVNILYEGHALFLRHLYEASDDIWAILTEVFVPSQRARAVFTSLFIMVPLDFLFTVLLVFVFLVISIVIISIACFILIFVLVVYYFIGSLFLFSIFLFLFLGLSIIV